jgi:hypothetical protein
VEVYPEKEPDQGNITFNNSQISGILRGSSVCSSSVMDWGPSSTTFTTTTANVSPTSAVANNFYIGSVNPQGATTEGSLSTQQFTMDDSKWETYPIPVVFDIWMKGVTQETSHCDAQVPFKIVIRGGAIWIQDEKKNQVCTSFIGLEGNFVRIKTTNFEFASKFPRDALTNCCLLDFSSSSTMANNFYFMYFIH